MSDVSDIGVRVSLVGGRTAAVEAEALSKSIKGIGRSVEETDVITRRSSGGSGGLTLYQRGIGRINKGLADVGAVATRTGARLEGAGVIGGAAIGAMGEKFKEAESKSKTLFGQVSNLGKYLAIGFSAAAVAATYEVSKLAINFDATVARIAGNADITITAANQIGSAFLHTAGYMTQSGQEMAEAFAPVAGQLASITGHALTTAQSLTFMRVSARLAEATETSLTETTAALAQTMQAYHLNVSQAADASNILFNISKQTNVGIGTLGNMVSMLHARLGQAIPSLSDMGGLMEAMIHQGASSSRSLRTVQQAFSTLLGGGKPVNDMLAALGVHIFDAQGKFVGMSSVIAQLQPKFASLPPQLQLLAEKTLFGAGAEELLGQVVLAGAQSFDAGTAAVQRHNAVESAAEKQVQTTRGQWKVFVATLEDYGVMIGEWLLPRLTRFGNWLLRHRAVLAALAIVIGIAVVGAIGVYIASIIIATTATAVFWTVATLGIAVAAVAIVAGILWLSSHWSRVWSDIKQWTRDAAEWIVHHAILIGIALGPIGWILVGLAYLGLHWHAIWTNIKRDVKDAWDFLKPIFDKIGGALSKIGDAGSWLWGHTVGLATGGHSGSVGADVGSGLTAGLGPPVGASLSGALGVPLPSYAKGGVIPGRIGAPLLAVVHGGETVVPPAPTPLMTSPVVPAASSLGPSAVVTASQFNGDQFGPPGTPVVLQVVLDRKVLAEATYSHTRERAART